MDLPTQIEVRLARLGVHPETVEERFVRGAGPGGQKINKTSSTVTLRHEATGVEVRCQAGRSQAANRERAWELLCEKLEARRAAARAVVACEQAAERARKRRPSAGARRRNVAEKRRRGEVKAKRGRIVRDE
jgi:protein subunit release factor B